MCGLAAMNRRRLLTDARKGVAESQKPVPREDVRHKEHELHHSTYNKDSNLISGDKNHSISCLWRGFTGKVNPLHKGT